MKRKWIIGGLVVAAISGAVWYWQHTQAAKAVSAKAETNVAPALATAVSALGRIEPAGGVTRLSVPGMSEGARVARLLVSEGEAVTAGQVVAVLESESSKQAALQEARRQVTVAEARLTQTRAPAKVSEQAAQQHSLARWQAELVQAERELKRYAELVESGDLAAARLEGKRLAVDTLKAEIERTKAQQAVLTEYRQVDAAVIEAEIAQAQAAVARLANEITLTRLTAPVNGHVIKVHARVGEAIGAKGLLEIGRTDAMYAIAEVYETDITRVTTGQTAQITARALTGTLRGKVERLGWQIGKKETPSNDPAADSDARVVEVFIRLDETDSARVKALTNLRVEIVIGKEDAKKN